MERVEAVLNNTPLASEEAFRSITKLRVIAAKGGASNLISDVLRISDTFLDTMFRLVHAVGLRSWCPDLTSPPDSMYNMVHEMIAIQSFRTICGSLCYNWMHTDNRYAQNTVMLAQWYRHSVFYYHKNAMIAEAKVPGSAEAYNMMSNKYRRRKAVRSLLIL